MEQVLLVIHVIIAAALIGMVLIQRSETDGFGLGSGGGSNLLSGRAKANLLTRTTGILAGIFILNSLLLSILAAHHRAPSIVENIENEQIKESFVPAASADKTVKKSDAKSTTPPSVPNAGVDASKKEAQPEPAEIPAAGAVKAPIKHRPKTDTPASNEPSVPANEND